MLTRFEMDRVAATESRMWPGGAHWYLKSALSAAATLCSGPESYLNHSDTRAYLQRVRDTNLRAYRAERRQEAR